MIQTTKTKKNQAELSDGNRLSTGIFKVSYQDVHSQRIKFELIVY